MVRKQATSFTWARLGPNTGQFGLDGNVTPRLGDSQPGNRVVPWTSFRTLVRDPGCGSYVIKRLIRYSAPTPTANCNPLRTRDRERKDITQGVGENIDHRFEIAEMSLAESSMRRRNLDSAQEGGQRMEMV